MIITIAHLYPDLLNLYGDYGNIAALSYRIKKRGFEVSVKEYGINDCIDFENTDIIYIGGGAEKEQLTVCSKLIEYKKEFLSYVQKGGVVLAVSNGFEILGESFETESGKHEGLGAIAVNATWNKERFIDDVIIESEFVSDKIVGFENHNSRMNIGSCEPLGKVLYGSGNNGNDKNEGCVYKNVVATYLHGPVLPKNPKLTDRLISMAIVNKGGNPELSALDDCEEIAAHDYIVNRFLKQ